ncbi:MAG: hypothetical protein EXQ88_07790 [Alphaproteobacteria bacterium]|nr:hypothetical protein [Alphaproteobacteria bacterium]
MKASDPPTLTTADLAEDARLSDRFTLVPLTPQPADAPAQTALGFRSADGAYQFLQFQGTLEVPQQLWNSGDRVRILRVNAGVKMRRWAGAKMHQTG